jgi:hypothetical protein
MAANAQINILGADKTAQAFASVQNRLTKIHATAKQVGTGLASFFGFAAVIGGIRRLDASLSDAEVNAKKLGLTSEELDKLTVATDAADQAAMALQRTLAKTAAGVAGAFTGDDIAGKAAGIRVTRVADELRVAQDEAAKLQGDIANIGKGRGAGAMADLARIEKMRTDANAIAGTEPLKAQNDLNKALAIELSAKTTLNEINKEHTDSMRAAGIAQNKLYATTIPLGERIVGLRAQESRLLQKLANTTDKEAQTQIYKDLEVTLTNLAPLMEQQAQLATAMGDAIASSFEDAIFSGAKFGDVLKSLALDLTRLIFRQSITAPLAAAFTSGLSGLFRAEGGPVGAGSPYIVGERGPELFVPSTAGRILNEHQMGNGGGGGGGAAINFVYNITSGVTRAELKPLLDQQRAQIRREIPDAVRRGGSYASAFA